MYGEGEEKRREEGRGEERRREERRGEERRGETTPLLIFILCSTAYLKHFHEYGCKLDAKTCANAAAGGNLECLKYPSPPLPPSSVLYSSAPLVSSLSSLSL